MLRFQIIYILLSLVNYTNNDLTDKFSLVKKKFLIFFVVYTTKIKQHMKTTLSSTVLRLRNPCKR